MKNILKMAYVLFLTIHLSCKAQVVPLNNIDSPNGAYEKDLDNVLPFWEGTWKGTVNNKEYTFQFVKFTQQQIIFSSGSYYYADMLMGKIKVVDLNNNQVLYNDLNTNSFNGYKIRLLTYRIIEYFFSYKDNEANCYNRAEFSLIKSATNPDQILYKDFSYGEYEYWTCTNYQNQTDIPMFLPKVNLILTRQ